MDKSELDTGKSSEKAINGLIQCRAVVYILTLIQLLHP